MRSLIVSVRHCLPNPLIILTDDLANTTLREIITHAAPPLNIHGRRWCSDLMTPDDDDRDENIFGTLHSTEEHFRWATLLQQANSFAH